MDTDAALAIGLSTRAVAVACVTIARYLQEQDAGFANYVKGSLANAATAGLGETDLVFLRLLVRSVSD